MGEAIQVSSLNDPNLFIIQDAQGEVLFFCGLVFGFVWDISLLI